MLTNEQLTFICVVVGFIPYFVKKQRSKGGYILEVRALFWSVQYNGHQLTVRVSLIERLRRVVWIVITHLRDTDDDSSQQ